MTKAQRFLRDTKDLNATEAATKLDSMGLKKTFSKRDGYTLWVFECGSAILISGQDIGEVIAGVML